MGEGKKQLKKRKREVSVAEEEAKPELTKEDTENHSDDEEDDDHTNDEQVENVISDEDRMTGKEFQRKWKAEMKRKKREAQLKLQKEKEVKDDKIQQLLQNDLERKSEEVSTKKMKSTTEQLNDEKTNGTNISAEEAIDEQSPSLTNGEPEVSNKKKKKKKSHEKISETVSEPTSTHVQVAEKEKVISKKRPIETSEINHVVAVEAEEVPKKKKKKKKISEDKMDVGEAASDADKQACTTESKPEDNSVNDSTVSEEICNTSVSKKKKKKGLVGDIKMNENVCIKSENPEEIVTENNSVAEGVSNQCNNSDVAQTPTSTKEKKKKRKKEMYRVDSDICFGSLSVSATNLAKVKGDSKIDEKDENKLPSIQETEAISEGSPVLKKKPADSEGPSSKKKSKKKLSRSNAATSLSVASTETKALPDSPADSKESSKMFEESNDWDCPLLPGETEIVLPNKKYKGSSKLKGAAESVESVPGFDSPKIEPVKSFTATFLKKAQKAENGEKRSKSEPRKKKINFALTNNCAQEMSEHLSSVKNSPQIPHDPDKNPTKTLLKKRVSLESGKRLNPVQLNTQLNSRSNSAKKLAGKKRASAMDFF